MIGIKILMHIGTAVLTFGLLIAACDITNPIEDVSLRLSVTDAAVELGPDAGHVAVTGGQTTSSTGNVINQLDISSVELLHQVHILPSYFSYASAVGKHASALGNGAVELHLFLGGVPIPGSPVVVTILDGTVTNVSPTSIDVHDTTIDKAAIEAALNSLPPSQRPLLRDWKSMTISQILGEINLALARASFPLVITAVTTGDIHGELVLHTFGIDAEIVM